MASAAEIPAAAVAKYGDDVAAAARWAVEERNALKVASRAKFGPLKKAFEWRNLAKYGDEIGSTAERLYEAKGSWKAVLEGAGRTSGRFNWLAGVR